MACSAGRLPNINFTRIAHGAEIIYAQYALFTQNAYGAELRRLRGGLEGDGLGTRQ